MRGRIDPTAGLRLKARLRDMPDERLFALTIDALMAMHPGVDRREAEVALLAAQATRRRERGL